jgi:hypothetical protein
MCEQQEAKAAALGLVNWRSDLYREDSDVPEEGTGQVVQRPAGPSSYQPAILAHPLHVSNVARLIAVARLGYHMYGATRAQLSGNVIRSIVGQYLDGWCGVYTDEQAKARGYVSMTHSVYTGFDYLVNCHAYHGLNTTGPYWLSHNREEVITVPYDFVFRHTPLSSMPLVIRLQQNDYHLSEGEDPDTMRLNARRHMRSLMGLKVGVHGGDASLSDGDSNLVKQPFGYAPKFMRRHNRGGLQANLRNPIVDSTLPWEVEADDDVREFINRGIPNPRKRRCLAMPLQAQLYYRELYENAVLEMEDERDEEPVSLGVMWGADPVEAQAGSREHPIDLEEDEESS